MRILTFLSFLIIHVTANAQKDTVYKYFNEQWNSTTKDSAFFIAKIVYQNNQWHRQDFWAATNVMQMDAYFDDPETEINNGPLMFFAEKGFMSDSENYEHGKQLSKYIFYDNHALKAYATFDNDGMVVKQAGYDITGKEIPGYIFQKPAEFPGGQTAWTNFLIKGLTTRQPRAYTDGKISGTVVISFLVAKDGSVQEVQVITSSGYSELDEHAENIIRKSPKWIPAIQYNMPVIYRQKQSLTYSPLQ